MLYPIKKYATGALLIGLAFSLSGQFQEPVKNPEISIAIPVAHAQDEQLIQQIFQRLALNPNDPANQAFLQALQAVLADATAKKIMQDMVNCVQNKCSGDERNNILLQAKSNALIKAALRELRKVKPFGSSGQAELKYPLLLRFIDAHFSPADLRDDLPNPERVTCAMSFDNFEIEDKGSSTISWISDADRCEAQPSGNGGGAPFWPPKAAKPASGSETLGPFTPPFLYTYVLDCWKNNRISTSACYTTLNVKGAECDFKSLAATIDPADACTGVQRSFTATPETTGSCTISYAWDFGDSTSGTGQKPNHTYAQPGNYTATVTATESSTGKQLTATVTTKAAACVQNENTNAPKNENKNAPVIVNQNQNTPKTIQPLPLTTLPDPEEKFNYHTSAPIAPDTSINEITNKASGSLLTWLGFLLIPAVIVDGLQFALAMGDEIKMARAKKTLVFTLIGFGIALVATLIVQTVVNLFQ